MAKSKPKSKESGKKNLNTPVAARARYLHQASTYLSSHQVVENKASQPQQESSKVSSGTFKSAQSMRLVSHMFAVSRKGQVRLSSDIKHSVCKCCNTVLIQDSTSTTRVENDSKHAKKPWADVRITECLNCGTKKRFPIGAKRQQRKGKRGVNDDSIKAILPVQSNAE